MKVEVGQVYETTDYRRPPRKGVVENISRGRARLRWSNGGRSTVAIERLSGANGGNRGFVLLPPRAEQI
ncbi:MAG: hypothetical protein K0V04_44780, partial [Deltaproteobacteria bacterium]|nr:hypothetical protein [Deltaproteobacteria bacterium]MCH9688631.1 hypothetical protein [Deltaproteobacteria bacterium]